MNKLTREEIVRQINLECDIVEDRVDEVLRIFCRELKKLDSNDHETWGPFGEKVYDVCKKFKDKEGE